MRLLIFTTVCAALLWCRFGATGTQKHIDYVQSFLQDMVEDPTPKAMHYGSKYDSPPTGAVRIKTGFRNRFYRME